MAAMSSLYDTRDAGYPLFYSGVLTFAITICLPLNLGLSKLPTFVAFTIFAVGFVSLFMLARNPQVGLDLLAHIHVSAKRKDSVLIPQTLKNANVTSTKLELETPPLDPFPYLQNLISSIVNNNQFEEMDPATKTRLVSILQKLQTVSKDIVTTQKN